MSQLIIYSHRGIDFGPENTLAAFEGALKAGCGLELDVRLTQDGNIAIIHDDNLERVTGVPGIVKDLTMAQIQHKPIKGSRERVPTFDDVAELLKEFPLTQDAVALHLKGSEQTEQLMALLATKIAEYGLEDVVFIFDVMRPAIDFLKRQNPRLRLAISIGAEHHTPTIFTMADLPKFTDVDAIWWDEWKVPHSVYTHENLRGIKAHGKKVYAISLDLAKVNGHPQSAPEQYRESWRELIDWGVDGLCTDVPRELLSFLDNA